MIAGRTRGRPCDGSPPVASSSSQPVRRLAPEVRREQLLDAALDVLTEQGFGGLSVEAVARRAGVTRPMVYGLFGDLDGLLLALIDREEGRALAPLLAIVGGDPGDDVDPEDFLVESVERFLTAVAAEPRTWRLVLMPPRGGSSELRERLKRSRRLIAERVTALLDWGVARRGGPAGLDHELFGRLIVAAGEDAARLVLARPDRFPPARLAAVARDGVALLPPELTPRGNPMPPLPAPPPVPPPGAVPEPGGRRRIPQAERRELLLDAALALVVEDGFGALSMEGIARRAEVNRVVVYRSFANVNLVLVALLRREERRARETLEQMLLAESAGRPLRALGEGLAVLLGAVVSAPLTWRLALMRPEDAPPALRKIVSARRADVAARLRPFVERGLAGLAVPAEHLDVEVLSRMLLSIGEEEGRLALDDPDFPPERLLASSWAVLDALP